MPFVVQELARGDLGNYQEGLESIYRSAFSLPPYRKTESELAVFSRNLGAHIHESGFRIVIALDADSLSCVGFAYGRKVEKTLPWYQVVSPHLERVSRTNWLENAYQLVEMAVGPEFQGQGVGTLLHDQLASIISEPRIVLTTMAGPTPARSFYERKGWVTILEEIAVTGLPREYAVMGLQVS